MKQLLQDMSSGKTSLIECPNPQLSKNSLKISTKVSLISPGTERMLVGFGKASYLLVIFMFVYFLFFWGFLEIFVPLSSFLLIYYLFQMIRLFLELPYSVLVDFEGQFLIDRS